MFTSRRHVANELEVLEIEFLLACFAKRVQRRLVTLYKSKKLEEYYNQEAAQVTWIYVLK